MFSKRASPFLSPPFEAPTIRAGVEYLALSDDPPDHFHRSHHEVVHDLRLVFRAARRPRQSPRSCAFDPNTRSACVPAHFNLPLLRFRHWKCSPTPATDFHSAPKASPRHRRWLSRRLIADEKTLCRACATLLGPSPQAKASRNQTKANDVAESTTGTRWHRPPWLHRASDSHHAGIAQCVWSAGRQCGKLRQRFGGLWRVGEVAPADARKAAQVGDDRGAQLGHQRV